MRFILYFMKDYYIRKICEEKISKSDVAHIYSTTIDNVEKAVIEYKINRNPFKKVDSQTKFGIIQIIVSIISISIVLLTLFEMQNQRNAAYLPNISFNCPGIQFAWGKGHSLIYEPSLLSEEDQRAWTRAEDSYIAGFGVTMKIQNTGVGVAKDVYIDWLYKENINKIKKLFSENNEISVVTDDLFINIFVNGKFKEGTNYSKQAEYKYGYLSSDLNNSEPLTLPFSYIKLYEYSFTENLWDSFPNLRFCAQFKDVQGKVYKKTYIIKPMPLMVSLSSDSDSDVIGYALANFEVFEEKTEQASILKRYVFIVFLFVFGAVLILGILNILAASYEFNRRRVVGDSEVTTESLNTESEITEEPQEKMKAFK